MTKPIAIITGGSSGIGKSISIELARQNFNIILISRNTDKMIEIQKEINLISKGACEIIQLDLSKKFLEKDILKHIKNPQNIEVLINNAGIGLFNSIDNISLEEWDKQINTNLRSAFLMTKMVVPYMKEKKNGTLLFVNSVAGLNPYSGSSAYVSSKYGLRGFSASLREELREYNIKVISVHPGAVNTPFWDGINLDFNKNHMLSSEDVSKTILHAILAPNNVVCEEIVIRRTAGDF